MKNSLEDGCNHMCLSCGRHGTCSFIDCCIHRNFTGTCWQGPMSSLRTDGRTQHSKVLGSTATLHTLISESTGWHSGIQYVICPCMDGNLRIFGEICQYSLAPSHYHIMSFRIDITDGTILRTASVFGLPAAGRWSHKPETYLSTAVQTIAGAGNHNPLVWALATCEPPCTVS
jgi:hypothetical protein